MGNSMHHHLSEKNDGGSANCLGETNPKQTTTLFHWESVPLKNNSIEQNQVVCKFSTMCH